MMLVITTSTTLYSKSLKTEEVFSVPIHSNSDSNFESKDVKVFNSYFFSDNFSTLNKEYSFLLKKVLEKKSNSKLSFKRRKLGKANINPFSGVEILFPEEKKQNFLFKSPLLFYNKQFVSFSFYYVEITPD